MDVLANGARHLEPPCVLCEVGVEDGKPIPHDHHGGRAPLTGCKPCYRGRHDACDPDTYYCTCSHERCRMRMR